jgi:four helix bundle protein
MKFTKFEEIIAWQKGQDIAVEIYYTFNTCKDFDFKRQICRATVSISNNIAEGFERNSNLDFRRFLFISLSSNSEVKSMLYLAKRLNFINESEFENLYNKSVEISKLLSGLIKSINPDKN